MGFIESGDNVVIVGIERDAAVEDFATMKVSTVV
jgi:hypothetical protein